jgi:hypothetical protein
LGRGSERHYIYYRGTENVNGMKDPSEIPLVLMLKFDCRQGETLGHQEGKVKGKKLNSY